MSDVSEVKEHVLHIAKDMLTKGLVAGTSGNVSMRIDDERCCITPSSIPYETMTLDDLTIIDMQGELVEGREGVYPSSEKALHTTNYVTYPEVNAVIHTHPVYATMFAITREAIPPIVDEFTMYVGGGVPVAEYAPSGTQDLADNATKLMTEVGAALLANHGLVSIGPSLERTLHIASLVERAAQIIHGARQLGEMVPLPDEVNANFVNVYKYLRGTPPS